ncbi:erythromycin esterase family protein [Kutzneria buriramensis]|uniref:Erythromycin esterase n=1 Tax=Kutzneria buriramensis TaxID=1045776 RepID=A0A3E0HL43_9PSEU|nr:erythromycin esterase family protein [Kutzneria buriramensis]REH47060.1 erythromycin esterase [Kutzneria buriramensis]
MRHYPLRTLDPADEDFSDLEPLREIVGDARVVAVGESHHRVHEFHQLRYRLTRFLVREMGFGAMVLESGFPEGLAVNDWVHGGPGDRDALLRDGITYRFGRCREMRDQLDWMRAHQVSFYGMDVPGSSGTTVPAIEACLLLLDDVDPAYAKVVRSSLLPLFDYLPGDRSGVAWVAPALQAYMALDPAVRHEITARIAALAARLQAMRVAYGGTERAEIAIRCAATARHMDAFMAAMADGATRTYPAANIRDSAMAENVEWILGREDRIVVCAANGHVQRWPYWGPPIINDKLTTVGEHLAATLGSDLVVIGSAFGGGTVELYRPLLGGPPGHVETFTEEVGPFGEDTIDGVLSRIGFPLHLTDLRGAALPGVTKIMSASAEQPIDPVTAFDAMVFTESVTPWNAT